MTRFLMGGLFESMWNNFYNAVVRNASATTKGLIFLFFTVLALMFILQAVKKVDSKGEKEMVQNWFAFWMAIVCIAVLVIYIILLNL